MGDLREVFLQAWASILAVFIVFCISQLVYQNIKTPLSSFFTFKIEEHPKISNEKTNYYKVGSVIDGKQLIETFREKKIIGISWNDLGDINELLKKIIMINQMIIFVRLLNKKLIN
ncbi:hypothetical protein [Fructobacillus tropaeoli]|uniref:Uncharacterized protein n=1 Tax=Fructobacillus tropaeoli TaxID=709323 RepID=A0A3F3H2M6_9LACO|nr:hypothetical protein [Fructobacillus tropaeoli]GAP04804.1 hypothetical protein FTRO_0090050 [Fructobacillus tropaeoli]